MKKFIAAIALTTVAACGANQVEKIATPSGNPEATFKNTTKAEVSDKIINACASRGRMIEKASESSVVCRDTVLNVAGAMAHTMYKLSLGNSYSSDPDVVYTYNITKVRGNVKVYVSRYVELVMPFGQPRRENGFNAAQDHNRIVGILKSIGGEV